MTYYRILRMQESGGSVPVSAGTEGQLVYGREGELRFADERTCEWALMVAKRKMPTYPGQLGWKIGRVQS